MAKIFNPVHSSANLSCMYLDSQKRTKGKPSSYIRKLKHVILGYKAGNQKLSQIFCNYLLLVGVILVLCMINGKLL